MPAGWEPGHVPDVAEQPRRARGTDSVPLEQGAAGGFDEFSQFLIRGFDALVDTGQLNDQLCGEAAAGLARRTPRPKPGQAQAVRP